MSASTLTSKQRRTALRAFQTKKKNAKNVLLPPIRKEWARLRPQDMQTFKEKLERAFQELNIERNKLQYKRGKDKAKNKKEALETRNDQLSKEQKELRSSLVLGLNAVTRSLEKKSLRLVLVDANTRPSTLTNHLLWLSETCSCKCIAVPELLEILGDILNVTSLVAIGIKHNETLEDKFADICKIVEDYSTEPQKDPETEIQNPEEREQIEDNMDSEEEQEEDDMEKSGKTTKDFDFRKLYVYKKDLPLTEAGSAEPSPPKRPKTEQFIAFSKDNDDDFGVKRRKFPFHKVKIARIEGNPDRDSSKKSKISNKKKKLKGTQ